MQWYYSKNSTQLGPLSQSELAAKIASGEVLLSDMAWRDGMANWAVISSLPEFTAASSGAPYTPPQASYVPVAAIPNYLWQAIAVTILCCWPLGIPAIVYAAKVDSLRNAGNVPAALEASANAKKWCIIALCSGLVVMVLYVLVMVGGMANVR